ncbi:MAG: hypothetical protein AB8G05_05875 [Oligoflexales bacterium]
MEAQKSLLKKDKTLFAGEHESHPLVKRESLQDCCKETIKAHAQYNPMMLCQVCKHLIKCFKDGSQFRNYIIFCESRGRQIYIDSYDSYQVVVFRNYEPFR